MNFVKASLLFFVLWLAACSIDDEGVSVVARVDEYGIHYSPTCLRGKVDYLKVMKPEKVKIVSLDAKLYPVDSIEVPVEKSKWGEYYFSVSERDYEQPFVKIVPVFPLGEKAKMEFAQYLRLRDSNTDMVLSLSQAVTSGRIEKLMREDGLDFDEARVQAVKEMGLAYSVVTEYNTVWNDVFSNIWDVYEYMGSSTNLNALLIYIYCQHEVSDSAFYSTFKAYRESFAKSGLADSVLMAKSADAWLSTFVAFDNENGKTQYRSLSRDTVVKVSHFDENFFRHAYGAPFRLSTTEIYVNEFFELENKYSSFNGRTFVYDRGVGFWRLQTLLDDSVGVCLYAKDSVAVSNGVYYRCRPGSAVWNVESNRDTILNKMYGYCKGKSIPNGESGYLSDSLFVCECDSSQMCAWTDKYVNTVFQKDDKLYASALNAKAVQLFGKCSEKLDGEVREIDGVSVSCSWDAGSYVNKWRLVESE